MSKKKRFISIHSEGTHHLDSGKKRIIIDDETGDNYLFVKVGTGAGLTTLIDADGKPLRSKLTVKKD